ncbi:unnamed protein product [Rotaria sordida]|uniref:Uncharacterized protein n=1 Tax=Rotaria sordida TaxID=392033 RepID=A0A815IFA8_9BILA|nr:unnamed protein product [Rotaria sordida]
MQLDKNADNGETLASTYCENQLDFDIDMNDMEDEQDNIVEETSIEDVICWPTLKEKIPSLSGNKKDLDSFENIILQGVVDVSPFSKLIGFHATTSLPNDLMHDFNEGLCSQILLAMIKEASTKRILSYGDVEDRLMSFEYGLNDKSNKPPILRKKHLNKGKIVDTKEIYICLREIISHLYASPFRKSWLPYLHSLTVRFQSLMVHLLPNLVISKVHLITHYAKQVEMYGPPIRHWCMRFESKHQIFKQLAVKSNNFKNILYTLSKRHQLRQCLLLSLSNYYKMINEGYSSTERNLYALPADVREDIDGETLFNLPESIMYEIIKPIKERIRFLAEHRALFHNKFQDTSDQITSKKYTDNLPVISSQQVIEQPDANQFTSMSTITFSNNDRNNSSTFDSSTDSEVVNKETMISLQQDNDKENYEDEEQPHFPIRYHIFDLPPKIQQIIDKDDINGFRGHTNARRLLLDAIFMDVTTKYSLFYPDTHEYRSMGIAILEKLNIKNDNEALNDWIESLKNKFKRERRPLQQISEEVLKMKLKFGNRGGRPVKQTDNVIAARREAHVEFWNKVDVNDDPQEIDEHIQFMKNELAKESFNLDSEPLSPRPTIQVTTDKFLIYLDYNVITETASIDQALCIIISLYVIFELQFGTHNRIIHLLYGILLQDPATLTKQLRFTLKQWNFEIDKKERKQKTQLVNHTSTNNNTPAPSINNLQHRGENEPDYLSDEEPPEDFIERTYKLDPLIEVKKQLSKYAVGNDVENPTMTTTIDANVDHTSNNSKKTSQSFSSSTATTDSQSLIHSSSLKQRHVETSISVLSDENRLYSVKMEHTMIKSQKELPPTKPPIHIASSKKRRPNPEEPISSRCWTNFNNGKLALPITNSFIFCLGSSKTSIVDYSKNSVIDASNYCIVVGKLQFEINNSFFFRSGSSKTSIVGSSKTSIVSSSKNSVIDASIHSILGSWKNSVIGFTKNSITGALKNSIASFLKGPLIGKLPLEKINWVIYFCV